MNPWHDVPRPNSPGSSGRETEYPKVYQPIAGKDLITKLNLSASHQDVNKLSKVTMFTGIYNDHGVRKYLSSSEIDLFIDAAKSRQRNIYLFCFVLAHTGCRISECLSLKAESFDLTAGGVIIESLKKRRRRIFRSVPLSQELLDLLQAWFESGSAPRDRLWPWSRMTGYRRVCEVMREAGLIESYATPKGLRHGFAVRAIQSGVSLNLVQRWLGHADIKTTAIYTNAIGPEEREIATRMWRRMPGSPGSPAPPSCRRRARAAEQGSSAISVPQSVALELGALEPALLQWLDENLKGPQRIGHPKVILLYCAL